LTPANVPCWRKEGEETCLKNSKKTVEVREKGEGKETPSPAPQKGINPGMKKSKIVLRGEIHSSEKGAVKQEKKAEEKAVGRGETSLCVGGQQDEPRFCLEKEKECKPFGNGFA